MLRVGSAPARPLFGITQTSLSVVTAVLTASTAFILLVSILTHDEAKSPLLLLVVLAVASVLLSVGVVLTGSRLPLAAAGTIAVLTLLMTTVLTLTSSSALGIVSNGLFYPAFGLYLMWFFPRVASRAILYSALALYSAAALGKASQAIFALIIGIIIETVVASEVVIRLRERLEAAALTDPLTSADNLRSIRARGDYEVSLAERESRALAVAVIDLDGFKQVNDRKGHAAGDSLLVRLVRDLRHGLRPYDSIGRIGGDEFVLVLPSTSAEEATTIVTRLQAGSSIAWSFGVAEYRRGDAFDELCERADMELYRHKRRRAESGER